MLRLVLFFCSLLVVVGCDSEVSTPPGEAAGFTSPEVIEAQREADAVNSHPWEVYGPGGYDEYLAAEMDDEPRFAGAFSENGRTVFLVAVDATGRARALGPDDERSMVNSFFGGPSGVVAGAAAFGASDVEFRSAEFTFRELVEVKETVWTTVAGIDGFVFLDLNEKTNRVEVGVENADTAAFDAALRPLIASGAVRIIPNVGRLEATQMPPRDPDGTADDTEPTREPFCEPGEPCDPGGGGPPGGGGSATLQDEHRPLVGGTRMSFEGEGPCTLTVPGWLNNQNGFLTNSHCSSVTGSASGQRAYQPLQSVSPGRVGIEAFEMPWTANLTSNCPSGGECRFADVTWVFSQPSYAQVSPGVVADAPKSSNAPPRRSRDIAVVSRHYPPYVLPKAGDRMGYVSQRTGRRTGEIGRTCLTVEAEPDKYYLCQMEFTLTDGSQIEPGDSGAPVFWERSESGRPAIDDSNTVTIDGTTYIAGLLTGIQHTRFAQATFSGLFSFWWDVEWEIEGRQFQTGSSALDVVRRAGGGPPPA